MIHDHVKTAAEVEGSQPPVDADCLKVDDDDNTMITMKDYDECQQH